MTLEAFLRDCMVDGSAIRLVPAPARNGVGVEFLVRLDSQGDTGLWYLAIGDEVHRIDRTPGE